MARSRTGTLKDDPQFITALARGLSLLRAFHPGDGPLGNKELAERTRLPRPTVARITHTLTRLGYLEHVARLEKYRLGPAVLSLGYAFLSNLDLRAVAHPMMAALANDYHVSVCLGARDALSMIYIDVTQGADVRTIRLDVGSQVPIGRSAMGMALLGALPAPERTFVIDSLKARHADVWPRLSKMIDRTTAEIEERGFCVACRFYDKNINAAAAPVVFPERSAVFAINCAAPVYQYGEAVFYEEIGPRLYDLSRDIAAAHRKLHA